MFDFDFEELPPEEEPPEPTPVPCASATAAPAVASSYRHTYPSKTGPPSFHAASSVPQVFQPFSEPRIYAVLASTVVLREAPAHEAGWRSVRQKGELIQVLGSSGPWLRLAATESALDGVAPATLWLHCRVAEDRGARSQATARAALQLFRGIAAPEVEKLHVGESSVQELDHDFALGLYTQTIVDRCSDNFAPPLGCLTVDPRRLAGAFQPVVHGPGGAQVRAIRKLQDGPAGFDSWQVLAARSFRHGSVVEVCPLLATSSRAYTLCKVLNSRIVSCTESKALPLGFGAIYGRARSRDEANVQYGVISSEGLMVIHTSREVAKGEELTFSLDALPLYLEGDARLPSWSPNRALQVGLTASAVQWAKSPVHMRGVFAPADFEEGDILELAPAVVLEELVDGVFDDYTMEFNEPWGTGAAGKKKKFSVLALGFGALYNHKDPGYNVIWGWLGGFGLVEYRAAKAIKEGEELFITYGAAYWTSRSQTASG